MTDKRYITMEEAARRLGVSTDDLWSLTLESGRPSYIVNNREVFYAEEDIEHYRARLRS